MRRSLQILMSVAVVAVGAFAQTANTRILSTIIGPGGTNPSGTVTVSWNRMQNDANPRQTIAAGNRTYTITAGVVDVSLFPNTVALPAGTCYTANYRLNGQTSIRYWTVPVSATPVILNIVEGSIPCAPQTSSAVAPGQITDGGASVGQVLTWNGSYWHPGDGGGSGGTPGGTNGQLQFNNLGAFGGFTVGGDCVLNRPNFICTKTNGVAFAPSATIDTTNATNISSGTLAVARGGTGTGALTPGSIPFIGVAGVYSQNNANLFWDNASGSLGIGTNIPASKLDITSGGDGLASPTIRLRASDSSTNGGYLIFNKNSGVDSPALFQAGDNFNYQELKFNPNGGRVSLGLIPTTIFATGDASVGGTVDEGYRLDVRTSGSAGTMRLYDQTPTTGVTQQIIRAGAGQNAALTTWRDVNDNYLFNVNGDGTFWKFASGEVRIQVGLNFDMASGGQVRWFNATNIFGASADIGFSRTSAGVVEVNNGTSGTLRDMMMRDLTLRSITGNGAFDWGSGTSTRPNLTGLSAAIPATCSVGQTYFKTDAVAGANIFGCTSANVWTAQGATGTFAGILPVANGGTGTSTAFTAGSVVYAGAAGVYTQDNARFFWDNTNHRLGLGTATPGVPLDVIGVIRASTNFQMVTQAEPTCNSGNSGKLNYLAGGSGSASQVRVCVILPDDSFAWVPII